MKSLAARGAPRAKGKKYRTERIIGRGAFGVAVLVRSQADSRLYVMKRVELEHMPDKVRWGLGREVGEVGSG